MAAVIHGLRETGWRWWLGWCWGVRAGPRRDGNRCGRIFSLYVAVFVLMAAYNRNKPSVGRGAWPGGGAGGGAGGGVLMAGHAE